jgi:hypothetical protein
MFASISSDLSGPIHDCPNLFWIAFTNRGDAEAAEDSLFFAHRETAMGKNSHAFRLPPSPGKRKKRVSVFPVPLW